MCCKQIAYTWRKVTVSTAEKIHIHSICLKYKALHSIRSMYILNIDLARYPRCEAYLKIDSFSIQLVHLDTIVKVYHSVVLKGILHLVWFAKQLVVVPSMQMLLLSVKTDYYLFRNFSGLYNIFRKQSPERKLQSVTLINLRKHWPGRIEALLTNWRPQIGFGYRLYRGETLKHLTNKGNPTCEKVVRLRKSPEMLLYGTGNL